MKFYFKEERVQEDWIEKLRSLCLTNDFKSFYTRGSSSIINSLNESFWAREKASGKLFMAKVYNFNRDSVLEDILHDKIKKQIFFNEIQALKYINHPNVARLRNLYEADGSITAITQFVGGSTLLNHIISKGGLAESETSYLMRILLQTVQDLHSQQILHRNLKPENILIDYKPNGTQLVLTSFNFSCTLDPNDLSSWYVTRNLCSKCGTPGYMAPEILSEKQSTPASDVFSMGIILYACLTGEALFKGSDSGDIINKNCQVIFDKSSDKWVNLSDNAKHLILSMIEKDPYKRPAITEILNHPFFSKNQTPNINNFSSTQDEDSADLRNRRMSIEKNLAVKDDVECLTMSKAIQSLIVPMSYFDFSNTGVSQTPEFYINEMSPMESSNCGDQSPTAVRIYDSPKHAAVDTNRRFSIKLLPINKQEKPFHLQLPALPEQSEEFEASPFGDESVLKDEESPQIFRKTQTMPNAIPFTKSPFLRSNALLTHSVMRKHGTIA